MSDIPTTVPASEMSGEVIRPTGFAFTAEDTPWLRDFGITAEPAELNANVELQQAIADGSEILSKRPVPADKTRVTEARQYVMDFFDLSDIDTVQRDIKRQGGNEFVTSHLLNNARYLAQQAPGIRLRDKVIKKIPMFLGLTTESVQAKIENLQRLAGADIDLKKVIETLPGFFGYAPESVQAKIENLQRLAGADIDLKKVIESLPVLLGYAPVKVELFFGLLEKARQKTWFCELLRNDPKKAARYFTCPLETIAINLSSNKSETKVYREIDAQQRQQHFLDMGYDWPDDTDIVTAEANYPENYPEIPANREQFIRQFGFAALLLLNVYYSQEDGQPMSKHNRPRLVAIKSDQLTDPAANSEFFQTHQPEAA